jgi:hypothetical protein
LSSARFFDNEHDLSIAVEELGQSESAVGRGVACCEAPYSLQQRFTIAAGYLAGMGAVSVQDSQVGALLGGAGAPDQ